MCGSGARRVRSLAVAALTGRTDPKDLAATPPGASINELVERPANVTSSSTTTCYPRSAPKVPREVVEACSKLERPIVVSHVVPDADALDSMLAVAGALNNGGCPTLISLPKGSLSQRLTFLVELAGVEVACDQDFGAADGFIVLDTAKLDRCNVGRERKKADWVAGRPLINIDHHGTNTKFGTTNWIVDTASSTAELTYFFLVESRKTITPTIASALYAGIVTDTLGFSLPTTGAAALAAASALVELGADIALLGERLCRSQTKSEFDLLRIVYSNTRVTAGGRVAYSFATYDDIHDAGCTAADIDEQISVPRSLAGVELAMLFTEGNQGKTRINFRGSGNVTVVGLAGEFGGGGHAQAAGAVLECGVDEAVGRVVPRAEVFVKQFKSSQG